MNEHILKWRLYSCSGRYRYKLKNAIDIIEKARELNLKWSISWSGGKDSTALTHLVRSVVPDTEIICQVDDCDLPEKRPYVDRISERFGWKVNFAAPDFSVQDALMNEEYLKTLNQRSVHRITHSVARDAFAIPLRIIQKKLGVNGFFMGLRRAESNARKINFIQRGNLYFASDGFYRCLPLERWEAADSFAYLVSENIEINPCYFKNRFEEPESIRTSWAVPSFTAYSSDEEHIRYYYPEIWEKLKERKICQ